MDILKNLGTGIAAVWMGLTSFLGFHQQSTPAPEVAPQALGAFNPAGGLTYRLQTSAGSTDTTIRLSSFKNRSGLPLTLAANSINSSIGYGTLDPQNPTRSEFISFTGVTQNTDGTAILTGVTRGLSDIYPYNASTTLRVAHSGQSIFILSDSPQHFSEYAVKKNNELIPGAWQASSTNPWTYDNQYNETSSSTSKNMQTAGWVYTNFVRSNEDTTINATTTAGTNHGFVQAMAPKNASDVANKAYVDGVAVAGAPNASQTVKGIVEEATVQEINAGTAAGGTGAELFINPAQYQYSTFASSSPAVFSTSTSVKISTSTVSTIPSKTYLEIVAYASTTPSSDLRLNFNGDVTATYSYGDFIPSGALGSAKNQNYILLTNALGPIAAGHSFTLYIRVLNQTLQYKQGEWTATAYNEQTGDIDNLSHGTFMWKNNTQAITSASISAKTGATTFDTNLFMRVAGY